MSTIPYPPRWQRWTGLVLSAIPVFMMCFSAYYQQTHADMFDSRFGISASALNVVGVLEVVSVILYVIPPTAVLGAILTTGYFGGAILAHLRIGDPALVIPLAVGLLAWAGLYLREPRLRQLLPLRKRASP